MITSQPEIILHRQSRQNRCFDESLGTDLRLRMMLIPAGTFVMGSPEDELDRLDSEGPQHEVTISAFSMGKYPVTQAQWRFVARLPEEEQELEPDPARFKGDNRPVEQVSWYDALEFCRRLSTHTGREYRLPSEAEWEYACRAGTTTPFHFGETITTELANYRGTDDESIGLSGSYGQGPKGEYREETTPVDHFGIANGFGLCDMHGNVLEWCQDEYHGSYEEAPTDGSAWGNGGKGEYAVIRGGSWDGSPWVCRSAYRLLNAPRESFINIGFRVVSVAPRTLE